MTSMGFDPGGRGTGPQIWSGGDINIDVPLQKFMLVVCICEYDIVI